MSRDLNAFENVSYEQAVSLIRQRAGRDVGLITSPFPGMSFQFAGTLFVQEEGQFAFAVASGEGISVTVMPFPEGVFQIPAGGGPVEALVAAIGEPEQETMMWMLRFEE